MSFRDDVVENESNLHARRAHLNELLSFHIDLVWINHRVDEPVAGSKVNDRILNGVIGIERFEAIDAGAQITSPPGSVLVGTVDGICINRVHLTGRTHQPVTREFLGNARNAGPVVEKGKRPHVDVDA